MPSFVPKEQETDMAYVPGTIQYRRRLEQERSAKLAAVSNSAVSVDKVVDNSPTPPPLSSDQIALGDERSSDTQPSGIEHVGSEDNFVSQDKRSTGDERSYDAKSSDGVISSVDVQPLVVTGISLDTVTSVGAVSSHDVISSSDVELSPIVAPAPYPAPPELVSLQPFPTPVELVSSDNLSSNAQPSSVAQPSAKPKRLLNPDIPRLAKLKMVQTKTVPSSPVHIYKNFAFRDRDLVKYMREMTGDEWKVYCYLVSVTHEKWEGETHCWTSHHVIKEETGVGCKRTVGLLLESLEAKGFIRRTFTGNRVVKMSQYRVFLPAEREGYVGPTKVAYEKRSVE